MASGSRIALRESDTLQDDSLEDVLVTEALEGIEDLDAGQPAVGRVIGRYTFRKMLGSNGGLYEANVQDVIFSYTWYDAQEPESRRLRLLE